MSEKPVKPIPIAGSWIQNVNERAILYVSEVDPVKERFRIKRFARHGAEGMEFYGRTTWLSYETYRKGSRYMPREAPMNPDNLPEKITREQAQEALELEGWSTSAVTEALDNAEDRIEYSMFTDRERAIVRAYLGKPAPAVTHEPVPPMLDHDGAIRMLQALGANSEAIEEILRDPRKALATARAEPPPDDLESIAAPTLAILAAHVAYLDAQAPAVTPPDGMPVTEETLTANEAKERLRLVGYSAEDASALVDFPDATRKWLAHNPDVPAAPILRAYVRGLDAKVPDPINVLAAQPTIADVLAAIEALRSEVRADRKPLLDAVDRVLGNHGPYGSKSDVVEVHLDAFKALRVARAKV